MKKYTLSIIIVVALQNLFCNHVNKEKLAISNLDTFVAEEIKQLPPTLEIEMSPYLVLEKPLKLTLRIKNNGNQPIHFYSALLNNRAFVPIHVHFEKKTIDVVFTSFHTLEASAK